MLRYYIGWYQQNFDNIDAQARDVVRINIRSWDSARKKILGGEDVVLSNERLLRRAAQRGETSWDEYDVCAEASELLGVNVEVPAVFDPATKAEESRNAAANSQ